MVDFSTAVEIIAELSLFILRLLAVAQDDKAPISKTLDFESIERVLKARQPLETDISPLYPMKKTKSTKGKTEVVCKTLL